MHTSTDLEHYADLLLGLAPPPKKAGLRTTHGPRRTWGKRRGIHREEDLRPAEECLFGPAMDHVGYRCDGSLAVELTAEERKTIYARQ